MKILMHIKDILRNDKLTEQAGLNPWCVNEGKATGEEWQEVEIEDVITESSKSLTEK